MLSEDVSCDIVRSKEASGDVANQIHCGELASPPSVATNGGLHGVDR